MKRIIAVDFDGTLCENKYPKIGEPNKELIEQLAEERKKGTAGTKGATRCSVRSSPISRPSVPPPLTTSCASRVSAMS